MRYKHLFNLIIVLAILPLVNAVECYQEFANTTSCGQSISGSYLLYSGGDWIVGDGSNLFDGNWNTNDGCDDSGCYLDINYTIPSELASAKWQIKNETNSGNVTVPIQCLQSSVLQFQIIGTGGTLNLFCKNNTDWYQFGEQNINYVYEEGIYWDILPSHSETQEDIIVGTLTSAGTGMAVLISAITNPLVSLFLGLAVIVSIIAIFEILWQFIEAQFNKHL